MNSFISKCSRTRYNANATWFVNVTRHDTDFALQSIKYEVEDKNSRVIVRDNDVPGLEQ
jgi:hypothetical protein